MKLTDERLAIIEPSLRKNPKAFDNQMKGLQQLAENEILKKTPDSIERIRKLQEDQIKMAIEARKEQLADT